MARIKTPKAPVRKKRVIIFMLLVGVAFTIAIAWVLFYLRQNQTNFFASDAQRLTASYVQAETSYITMFKQITQERLPVSEPDLERLNEAYVHIEQTLINMGTLQEDLDLPAQISQRKDALVTLKKINALLTTEKNIGDNMQKFTLCIQGTSFVGQATAIHTALGLCTDFVATAEKNITELPELTLISCPVNQTPGYVIHKIKDTHITLMAYYNAVASKNAAKAAATDQEYKSKANALKKLPNWNTCINNAITEQVRVNYRQLTQPAY